MTAPARFRQSDLERAHKATQNAGCREYRIILDLYAGKMEIVVSKADNDPSAPEEWTDEDV